MAPKIKGGAGPAEQVGLNSLFAPAGSNPFAIQAASLTHRNRSGQDGSIATSTDITDAMFEDGLRVSIYHIPSKSEVSFKAFLTAFSDKFDPSWNEQEVFGRNDPHQVFRGTKRTVTIGWKVLASGIQEALENMKKMSLLAQMQYPTYNSGIQGSTNVGAPNANAIQASPLFKLKFMNWVQDAGAPSSPGASAKNSGLVGVMAGFAFSPNLESGVFHSSDGSIYPKELSIDIQYTVLHTHNLGWHGGNSRQAAFPYGEDLRNTGNGRTAIVQASTRNSSGATEEQKEAKHAEVLQTVVGRSSGHGPGGATR